MKKPNFTKSQIVAAIRQQEGGISTKEACRQPGIQEAATALSYA